MELSERKIKVLKLILDDYIASGMPVGSRTIAKMWGGGISPATIRNEMSDLEEMGYLEQPHTSAGRVPSDLAYRYYVDQLLSVPALNRDEIAIMQKYVEEKVDAVDTVIERAAHLLSERTGYVSVALTPQMSKTVVKQVRLISVMPGRALLVLVTNEGLVKDSMVVVPEGIADADFDMISNALTERLRNKQVSEMVKSIEQLRTELRQHGAVLDSLIGALGMQRNEEMAKNVIFDGTKNLFKHPEYNNIENARSLLAALDMRDQIYSMMSNASDMQVTITIGSENRFEPMKNSSIVSASYMIGGKSIGSFGVIGPRRMNYSRVIAILEYLSNSISEMLTERE